MPSQDGKLHPSECHPKRRIWHAARSSPASALTMLMQGTARREMSLLVSQTARTPPRPPRIHLLRSEQRMCLTQPAQREDLVRVTQAIQALVGHRRRSWPGIILFSVTMILENSLSRSSTIHALLEKAVHRKPHGCCAPVDLVREKRVGKPRQLITTSYLDTLPSRSDGGAVRRS